MKRELHKASAFKKDIQTMKKSELKKAIVLSEILGQPKALKNKKQNTL